MKKVILAGMLIFFLVLGLGFVLTRLDCKWPGVDEAVVMRFAREAGRAPRDPHINTDDRGDLLLLFFLLAGVAGGFVGGYFYRELFPPKSTKGARNA